MFAIISLIHSHPVFIANITGVKLPWGYGIDQQHNWQQRLRAWQKESHCMCP
jgi:hypothetical protein